MVQGVGGTGPSGSISNISAYQVYYPMYQQYLQNNSSETQLDFESWLIMKGYIKNFTQQVENYLETGDAKRDDANKNTLDCNKQLSNSTGAIYQSEDEDTYYEFDWDSGTYKILNGKDAIAKALGMPEGKNIDTINFGYQSAVITDYTFGNLDDGQDTTIQNLYGKYGNVVYTNQEFDIHYILNALLMDETDPQYVIAKGIFDDLCKNTSQWLPDSELEELNNIAAQYGTNSAEYKAKLQEVLLANLDQAQEWVEEHTHVKNPNSGTLGTAQDATGTDGSTEGTTDGTTDGEDSTTGEVPSYNKETVMNSAGVLDDYTQGTWTSNKISWKNDAGKDTDKCREMAKSEAVAYATDILTQIETTLASQMGEQYTTEIQNYVAKAKTTVLADTDSWLSTEWHSAMLGKNRGHTSTCNTKVLIDNFFTEFDSLCVNKGKTTEEVEAEKKAAEEKAAQEKSAYQTLYNMDMNSTAQDAGINTDKDVQVVNATSAADIKSKAESSILVPLMDKIKSQLSGKGISDSDLNTFLNNAADIALSDCTEWATTSNNYVYNIDTDVLVSKFEEEVKKAVKAKGYDF